jgi:hypothetical protein
MYKQESEKKVLENQFYRGIFQKNIQSAMHLQIEEPLDNNVFLLIHSSLKL